MTRISRSEYPIPNTINWIGLLCSISLVIVLLSFASSAYRTSHWIGFAVCVSLFALFNNTNFSFLHEAVHGALHSRRKVNDAMGIVAAAFFPTSFTLQQYFHLGHHCRNRTDAEMFDLYYPHENVWLKRLVIYAMPSGFYWFSAVSANVVFLFLPWLWNSKAFRNAPIMKYSSFGSMLDGIPDTKRTLTKIRRQILVMIIIQGCIFFFCNVSLVAWLACYWLFGMVWGSLQYTDHAFSKRDIREGAWNLRADPITRLVFLNYHYHLAHHQHPSLPWIYLPRFVTADEERPYSWVNFFKLMAGPYLATELAPSVSQEFHTTVYEGTSMTLRSDSQLQSESHPER